MGLEALQAKGENGQGLSVVPSGHRLGQRLASLSMVAMPFLAQHEFPSRERVAMTDERNLFYVGLTRARMCADRQQRQTQPVPGEL